MDMDTVKSYLLDAALYVLKVVKAFEPTYDPVTKTLHGSTSMLIPKYDHDKSIGQQLFESLRSAGDKVTQINADTGVKTTAAEVLACSIRVAQNLRKLRVDVGDIVAICASNTDNIYPLLFGLVMSQVVVNTLDPNFKSYEMKHMLGITAPKLIFCDGANYSIVRTCLDDLNLDTVVITLGEQVVGVRHIDSLLQTTDRESQFRPVVKIDYENDGAFILCSSGTTGLCKAICLSQKSMLSSTKPPPIGTFFNFGSLYWMSGIGSTIFTTISGITRVFTKRSFDPDFFLDVVEKYKVTDFFGAPAYMALLSKHPRLRTADLSSLRNMIIGGAAFPDHYKQEVEKYWPGRQLRIAYGMSELGGIGCLSFFDYKPGCAGKPLMNYKVRVCGDQGRVLNLNQVGEIYLSSNCKFLGYYGDAAATEETKATDGFLKTGDLGYLDEDGFVFVVGRKKEMMKYANVAISPLELENLLSQHPDILDCCIVGIPDAIYESLVAALVVRVAGSSVTESEITAYLNSQVQDAKRLRGGVYFVDGIPLTMSGKPQRFAAQKIAIDLYNQKINVKSKM